MITTAYKFVFAAGGTGGHLFPAIAVAEQLKLLSPNSSILFVGTKDKIEGKVLPNLGFNFETIWISGFRRRLTIKNILFPIKVIVSTIQSLWINLRIQPNVAIGAGGYVAGPVVSTASLFGAKIVLLEQNSYPGVTNRMLEKKADKIHISFKDSRKYFKDQGKLFLTGNPVRSSLEMVNKELAAKWLELDHDKKILLVLGGSLGAESINKKVEASIEKFKEEKIQVIWQTGDNYYENYKSLQSDSIRVMPFISNMSYAYSCSDLIVARAGATTIAEVALLGLPVIFIPSANVAANHQYKNAKSIVDLEAGVLIEDDAEDEKFTSVVMETINDNPLLEKLKVNINKISKPDAAYNIAMDILGLAEENKN